MSDAHRAKVIRLMIASEEAGEKKFGEAENQNYDSQVQEKARQDGEEAAENKDGDASEKKDDAPKDDAKRDDGEDHGDKQDEDMNDEDKEENEEDDEVAREKADANKK